MKGTFYWHDYETWGTDPRRDRPAQFAGIRTDEDLNVVGKPLMIYCKPANDILPQPDACMVTGILPQKALAEGVCEADFMASIYAQLVRPGTCGVGYNSIRFDDEFTRYGLYRNFFDPYAREWQNGNSRWDIIDMVRLTYALRPEGIEWPKYEDGTPCFKLEKLTVANSIVHAAAHDALSDVHATIALAKLIKDRQPRLFDYIFNLRNKRLLDQQFDLRAKTPVLHVSSMFPAEFGRIAMVAPVARHPTNKNGVIVFDLRHDPRPFLELSVESLHERLFTPAAELPEGVERVPLKMVHLNKSPVVVPMNTLTPEAAERWQIDVAAGERHVQALCDAVGFDEKVRQAHGMHKFESASDPDHDLYGGFFGDSDRRLIDVVRKTRPQNMGGLELAFDDRRLPEMLFRYRARNWPNTLSAEENIRWDEFRRARITESDGGGSITLADYRERIAALKSDSALSEEQLSLLDDLSNWGESIDPTGTQ
ncbi:Exodeoxyribonuclease I [hydrothermal vent metagenome]|uniref:Exodeoxyribonuclease I n=1 Tax=hydrothermal vent metagenome TaxID=652676 RepID=A0A3B1B7Z6_9ZZZZ